MHNSTLIGLPDAPKVIHSGLDKDWPDHLESIDTTKYKYRSLGLRAQIYGNAIGKDNMRVGIELRDSSRDMNTWEKLVKQFHASAADKVWEKIPEEASYFLSPVVLGEEKDLMRAAGLNSNFIRFAAQIEKTMGIPLQKFEEAKMADFRTGGFRQADAATAKRIVQARERYLSELKKIEKNIHEIEARGEAVEAEDVVGAIRMTMSEWAKEARVSELFAGI
jgi:hypothetical protein